MIVLFLYKMTEIWSITNGLERMKRERLTTVSSCVRTGGLCSEQTK